MQNIHLVTTVFPTINNKQFLSFIKQIILLTHFKLNYAVFDIVEFRITITTIK